jgi:hypothetical protein
MKIKLLCAAATCAAAFSMSVAAQTSTEPPKRMTFDQVYELVKASLPPSIGPNNADLVKFLSGAKLDTENPLSKTFDPTKVSRAVFGRLSPNRDPSCARALTAAGDPDQGLCTSMVGEPNGTGLFTVLSYSKDMTHGDITFLKRPPLKDISPDTLKSVTRDPSDAYKAAVEFAVGTLGLSQIEIPTPPAGVDFKAIVNTLSLGSGQKDQSENRIDLFRVVNLKRGARLPAPIPVPGTAANIVSLTHILAPGEATLFLDDTGVQAARVEGWVSLPIDPKLDPRAAKTDVELADEIARELYAGGGQEIAKVQMAFALAPSGYPNPDDPNPPLCPACGVLRPVLRVVMYTSDTKIESPQGQVAAPGLVHEFQLVDGSQQAPVRPVEQ